ncbi:MAG: UDP-3-O-(3-hydroxymyristoyl)glucosamine N-acyltransferase [Phycisphaerae bacterium]
MNRAVRLARFGNMRPDEDPQLTVARIAEICGGRWQGPPDQASAVVRMVAPLAEAGADAVTWLSEERFVGSLPDCRAAAVIGTEALLGGFPRGIVVQDPEGALADVLDQFHVPNQPPALGVHPTAVVHASATLAPDVRIGANVWIGEGVEIGSGAVVHAGVSLGREVRVGEATTLYDRCVVYDRCRIGNHVVIHAGTVVGADGFGYIFRDGRHRKFSHLGTVIIEDEVEIGANTCIDRGKLGATRIGRGAKIDDLVMIAHNVQIGPLCIVTAQCGIAGSARLGSGVIMGGQSGLSHGISAGDGVRIASRAVLFKDAPPGGVVSGCPAQDHRTEQRQRAQARRLPRLLERVAALEKRVAELEGTTDH